MPRTEDKIDCLTGSKLPGTMLYETAGLQPQEEMMAMSLKKVSGGSIEKGVLEAHLLARLHGSHSQSPFSFGTKGKQQGHLFFPSSIARDPTYGTFLLSDRGGQRVQIFDRQGTFLSQLNHSFSLPSLAFDPLHNHTIIADFFSGEVAVFSAEEGTCSDSPLFTFGGRGFLPHQLLGPIGVGVSSRHPLVYVVDNLSHRVCVYSSSSGKFLRSFGGKGKGKGEFLNPTSVAISPVSGRVFVSDYSNNRIQMFSPSGSFLGMICGGGEGGGFSLPKAVVVDEEGRVFVTDSSHNELKCFTEEGEFLGRAGGFQDPVDVVVGGCGGVFVVDSGNHRVVKCNLFESKE